MIRRTIREWERIGYGTDASSLPEAIAGRIAAVAQRSVFAGRGGEGVLEHGRKWLRARGIVGVIATAECQLEILPKIEGQGDGETSDEILRNRLVHMLAVVHDLPIDSGAITQLGSQQTTILEILVRLFCSQLTDAVRQGMPRQYLAHEADLPTLRGSLMVAKQFSVNAVAPQRLACRFDELSPDVALNQVMRAAITKLSRLSKSPENQRSLRELSFAYAEVTPVHPTNLRWEQVTLNRTNKRWRQLLSFARLFLADRHQQTNSGGDDGYALLFEMHALFERYVAKLLNRALVETNLHVSAQGGNRDCLYEGEAGRFRTRPDLIVRQNGQAVLIIDTKWKRIGRRIDDPKQGVSQSDVYQLMAYSRLYECPNVMLLYPHHGGLPSAELLDRYEIAKQGADEALYLATLDLSAPGPRQVQSLRAQTAASLGTF